jgi:flavocytochrome c
MPEFDFTVPVLVAGGGACGAVAALAAHDAGVMPLLVERDDRPGGSTAMSQGLLCAAGTRFQAAHGVADSPDQFFDDIMQKARGQADPVIARLLADEAGSTLEWLCDAHAFPWTLETNFRAAYGNSVRRVHGWPGHSGADMIQFLHRRMSDLGIDVLLSTRLVEIITDEAGAVCGAALLGGDGETVRVGCDALILACGGFAANEAMVREHIPEASGIRFYGHESSEGDAIRIAARLGAQLGDMGSYQGYAMLADPAGLTVPPVVLMEGGILLNGDGRRFTDELEDIAGMVLPLSKQPGGVGWVVFDSIIEETCQPIPEFQNLVKLGAVRFEDTISGLAERMGVANDVVAAELSRIETARAAGEADAVGRDWSGCHMPRQGRFGAIRVVGALYHTQGGLQIDDRARVVRSDGATFSNLFAGGGSARSVSGPSSWGYLPAIGLTTALALGAVAGREAAGQVTRVEGDL